MTEEPRSRRLVIMRHAHAEAMGISDRERPLEPRGFAEAADAGRWLDQHGIVPQSALVSAALRTRQTWTALAEAAGLELESVTDESLYGADDFGMLETLRSCDDEVDVLLVIGHNPTISSLTHLLDDGEGSEAAMSQMAMGHPPAGVCVLQLTGGWADLGEGGARVERFYVGSAG